MSSPLTPPLNSSPHPPLSSGLSPSLDNTRNSTISLTPTPSNAHSIHKPSPNQFTTAFKEPVRPADSWETAYVFAFIFKFTTLCQGLDTGLRLRTVLDLERALEADTTSPAEPVPEVAEAKQILTDILTTFHENLKLNNPHPWQRWLKSYTDEIVQSELRLASCGGRSSASKATSLMWKENWIRSRENGFWDLDWVEKVHLLRILVDRQLTYSPKIRQIIDSNYEKSLSSRPSQKSSSSTATTTKSNLNSNNNQSCQNPLSIKPLGLDRHVKTWWQIDDSPRIYSSGNPYKANCTWTVLSSTRSEFSALRSSLSVDPSLPANPPPSSETGERRLKIPAMFTAGARKKAGGVAGKKVEQGIKFEWQLSKALVELAEPSIVAGEQRVVWLLEECARRADAEARKQRRLQAAAAPRPAGLTRTTPGFAVSSRLRSQLARPSYAVDSCDGDRLFERALRAHDPAVPVKRGRGRVESEPDGKRSTGEEDEEGASDSDGEFAPATNNASGRPSRKRQRETRVQPSQPRGERRSSRVRSSKADEEADEKAGVVAATAVADEIASGERAQVAWSRSQPASGTSGESGEGGLYMGLDGDGGGGGRVAAGGGLGEEGCVGTGGGELNGNISVWSRGKLVYVAGNNKYASKPVAVPVQRKKIIAKPGAGVVLKTREQGYGGIGNVGGVSGSGENIGRSAAGGMVGASSLAGLKARLASIGGGEDDDEDDDDDYREEKEKV